jgi:hypothetical protein
MWCVVIIRKKTGLQWILCVYVTGMHSDHWLVQTHKTEMRHLLMSPLLPQRPESHDSHMFDAGPIIHFHCLYLVIRWCSKRISDSRLCPPGLYWRNFVSVLYSPVWEPDLFLSPSTSLVSCIALKKKKIRKNDVACSFVSISLQDRWISPPWTQFNLARTEVQRIPVMWVTQYVVNL